MSAGSKRLDGLRGVKKNRSRDVNRIDGRICEGLAEIRPDLRLVGCGFRRIACDQAIQAASGLSLNGGNHAADRDVTDSDDDPVQHGIVIPIIRSLRRNHRARNFLIGITCISLSKSVSTVKKSKAGAKPAFGSFPVKLLFGSDCVFGGLGDAELYDSLRLDLNGFARLRIASNAGLTMRFHEPAQAGHNEHTVLFSFLYCDVSQLLEKSC